MPGKRLVPLLTRIDEYNEVHTFDEDEFEETRSSEEYVASPKLDVEDSSESNWFLNQSIKNEKGASTETGKVTNTKKSVLIGKRKRVASSTMTSEAGSSSVSVSSNRENNGEPLIKRLRVGEAAASEVLAYGEYSFSEKPTGEFLFSAPTEKDKGNDQWFLNQSIKNEKGASTETGKVTNTKKSVLIGKRKRVASSTMTSEAGSSSVSVSSNRENNGEPLIKRLRVGEAAASEVLAYGEYSFSEKPTGEFLFSAPTEKDKGNDQEEKGNEDTEEHYKQNVAKKTVERTCPICKKILRSSCIRHMQAKHSPSEIELVGGRNWANFTPDRRRIKPVTKKSRKKFQCPVCSIWVVKLPRHTIRVHSTSNVKEKVQNLPPGQPLPLLDVSLFTQEIVPHGRRAGFEEEDIRTLRKLFGNEEKTVKLKRMRMLMKTEPDLIEINRRAVRRLGKAFSAKQLQDKVSEFLKKKKAQQLKKS